MEQPGYVHKTILQSGLGVGINPEDVLIIVFVPITVFEGNLRFSHPPKSTECDWLVFHSALARLNGMIEFFKDIRTVHKAQVTLVLWPEYLVLQRSRLVVGNDLIRCKLKNKMCKLRIKYNNCSMKQGKD